MKSIFKIGLFISLLLFSCDEVFDYIFYVNNLTNHEISVIYHTGNELHNYWDTIVIEPTNLKEVFVEHAAGGNKLIGVDISIVFESFFIKIDTMLSNKNYLDHDLWEYNEVSEFVGEYTLDVDSTHFDK
jgi:hypothetical protein